MSTGATIGVAVVVSFVVLAAFTNIRTLGNAINLNTVTLST
jgi:hypothetical protein